MLTVFGVSTLAFSLVMYTLERRHALVRVLALGCLLASLHGFLAGTWPFRRGRGNRSSRDRGQGDESVNRREA